MTNVYDALILLFALIITVLSAVYVYNYLSLRIVLAIIVPPLMVFLQVGPTKHFWLNVLLTTLGYVPGELHAVWVIGTFPNRRGSST